MQNERLPLTWHHMFLGSVRQEQHEMANAFTGRFGRAAST